MHTFCRTTLLGVVSFLLIQPVAPLVPSAFASASAPAASKTKKRKHHKQNKEIILKGHHGKRAHRPA